MKKYVIEEKIKPRPRSLADAKKQKAELDALFADVHKQRLVELLRSDEPLSSYDRKEIAGLLEPPQKKRGRPELDWSAKIAKEVFAQFLKRLIAERMQEIKARGERPDREAVIEKIAKEYQTTSDSIKNRLKGK